jgi:hypothetical protein
MQVEKSNIILLNEKKSKMKSNMEDGKRNPERCFCFSKILTATFFLPSYEDKCEIRIRSFAVARLRKIVVF